MGVTKALFINSERCACYYKCVIFTHSKNWYLESFIWNCHQVNTTTQVNIGSGNGLAWHQAITWTNGDQAQDTIKWQQAHWLLHFSNFAKVICQILGTRFVSDKCSHKLWWHQLSTNVIRGKWCFINYEAWKRLPMGTSWFVNSHHW